MLVLNFPIEPMENRYSIEWDKWFREAFTRNDIPFLTMNGHTIQNGGLKPDQFLDPINSFKWKFSQLEQAVTIMNYRKEQIVIFLQDAWFPGIECFPYIRDMGKRGYTKVCGFLHGGSYLPKDITHGHAWAKRAENSFLGCMNKIFVGSQYHKDMICSVKEWPCADEVITVTGCPVGVPSAPYTTEYRGKIVVWPHRISADKRPDIFDRLADDMKGYSQFKDVQFIKTMEVCKHKMEYHNLLSHAHVAVSTSEHETFGISMVEAAIHGLAIAAPNALSYPEIFRENQLYNSYEQLVEMVAEGLEANTGMWDHEMDYRYDPAIITDVICQEIKEMFDFIPDRKPTHFKGM